MNTILGLDLGKFKSVACAYDPSTREALDSTIPTDPETLRGFLAAQRPDLVLSETCTVAGWLADACTERVLPHLVANPMGEAWRRPKVKRKTGRDDALKLARLAALGELPTVRVQSPEARQHRGLVASRARLVGRRTAVQNHLRALARAHGLMLPAGHRAWTGASPGDPGDGAQAGQAVRAAADGERRTGPATWPPRSSVTARRLRSRERQAKALGLGLTAA
jgi:transposase